MPANLTPLYLSVPIVDPQKGTPNLFLIQNYAQMQAALKAVPTVGDGYGVTAAVAGVAGQALYTTVFPGLYRVTYYFDKTAADGISSSLQFGLHWTENAAARSWTDAAFTTDTVGANFSNSRMFYCDASVGMTFDITYASNTPGNMKYTAYVRVEQMN